MTALDADDVYFQAVCAGLDTTLLATSKEIGTGFLYQPSFALDRNAVLTACHAHQRLLLRLLEIKQTPDLTKIQKALSRFYVAVGCLAIINRLLCSS